MDQAVKPALLTETTNLVKGKVRFSIVSRAWEGETVLCVGGGPSVKREIVESARGRCRVITVNNSYELAPWADAMYFADSQWWRWHKDRPAYKSFPGPKITIESTGQTVKPEEPGVHVLGNGGGSGFSDVPHMINTGSNSGFQVMNIAYLAGAKLILLLGYDMKFHGRLSHWHGDHPTKTPEVTYRNYAKRFASAVPQMNRAGVDVANCSPGSLIGNFRFSTVAAELGI